MSDEAQRSDGHVDRHSLYVSLVPHSLFRTATRLTYSARLFPRSVFKSEPWLAMMRFEIIMYTAGAAKAQRAR